LKESNSLILEAGACAIFNLAASTNAVASAIPELTRVAGDADVRVRLCALAWTPHWRDPAGTLTPAWT